ncbi:hypothetical protein GCM10007880_04660 [Mesorhizobium amorphae]|nr:hypothetical protein GCM10007880_04660 [Mesorhizobium amorphae]
MIVSNDRTDQFPVGDIADDELRLGRNRPFEAGRKPVEHDHALARIQKLPDHVAADIAGAARYQNRHPESSHLLIYRKLSQQAPYWKACRKAIKTLNVKSVTVAMACDMVPKQN